MDADERGALGSQLSDFFEEVFKVFFLIKFNLDLYPNF